MIKNKKMTEDTAILKEFIGKIHQFLLHEIQSNSTLSESSKESLTVASECINQAYEIDSKPASNELFNIYKTHKSGPQPTGPIPGFPNLSGTTIQDAMSLFSNLASRLDTTGTAGSTSATSNPEPTPQQATNNSETSSAPVEETKPKRDLKPVSEAEKLAADSFKNQGNDHMRTGNHQEAYDSYTKAIEIDPNNAIYYANRAAASSKLNKHSEALRDCRQAIEIDPKYVKAYGRLGLAYANLGDHKNSRDAYKKAVELEPDNEAHRDNLAIEEELCNNPDAATFANGSANATQAAPPSGADPSNFMSHFMSMMNNPGMMQMAMRTAQDPRIQNVLGSFVSQMQPPPANQQPPPGTS